MSDGEPIRLRRDDDLPACVRLLTDVHACDGYPVAWPADPTAWLTPTAMTAAWVAVDAGAAPVAHVTAVATPTGLEVSRLFVSPAARGEGLAAALLDAVLDAAGEARDDVALEVVDGTAAVVAYERLGWQLRSTGRAAWTTNDGRHPVVRRYVAPPRR